MKTYTIGLIGFGTVGEGVAKFIRKRKGLFQKRFGQTFRIKSVCDLAFAKKGTKKPSGMKATTKYQDIISDPEIDIVIELIGGLHPAKEIVTASLKGGKHVITANKALISNFGKELFKLAQKHNTKLYFESAVGAGVPIIKSITEGIVGNSFDGVYGIVNGTCNYILSEMTKNRCSFTQALKSAQKKGYAESDPTLDINGMDSAHKLAILIFLAFGKFVNVKQIHTEGITEISDVDIAFADSLNLTIKLLAIAKKQGNAIEARVHPTLISKDHPLASINDVLNAVYLNADPLGDILLSGEGAGQMAAASGVISDLINLSTKGENQNLICNIYTEDTNLSVKKIDQVKTKFYIRFMAVDNPGVLSKIAGVLGEHGIGINSVTQKAHHKTSAVPLVILTDYATEKDVRNALIKIRRLNTIKAKPVAIRMENLS